MISPLPHSDTGPRTPGKCLYLQESEGSRGRQLMYNVTLRYFSNAQYISRCASCHAVYFKITFISVNSANVCAAFIFVPVYLHSLQARDDGIEHGLLTRNTEKSIRPLEVICLDVTFLM